jgi:hypothetical protein
MDLQPLSVKSTYLYFISCFICHLCSCSVGRGPSGPGMNTGGRNPFSANSNPSFPNNVDSSNHADLVNNYFGCNGWQLSSCSGQHCPNTTLGERGIKRRLMCGYDKTSRPVFSANTTTTVQVAVTLFHILDTVSFIEGPVPFNVLFFKISMLTSAVATANGSQSFCELHVIMYSVTCTQCYQTLVSLHSLLLSRVY